MHELGSPRALQKLLPRNDSSHRAIIAGQTQNPTQNIPTPMEGEKLGAEKGRSGWTRSRDAYACADGAAVRIRAYVLVEEQPQDGADGTQNGQQDRPRITPVNGIHMRRYSQGEAREGQHHRGWEAVVAGVRMSRDMGDIVKMLMSTREIAFPRSVRRVELDAFWVRSLRYVAANEGLEVPGISYVTLS